MKTALVVSGGGFQGLALVKALRAVGPMRIVLLDCHAENLTRYFVDSFYQAPRLEPPQAFLDFALNVCREEGVDCVFAATEFELPLLAQHREEFARLDARVYVPDMVLLNLARDKGAFYAWLQDRGLPCLPCFDSPHAAAAALPLIGKPKHGWGGRGVLHLYTEAQIAALATTHLADYVWQPLLSNFEEYSVDFAVDWEGQASPLALRRRVRTSSGFAVLCEPCAPALVEEIAKATVHELLSLGARGPMNLQILHTGQACWVSDLNPRIGTSMPLALAVGDNPLTWLFKDGQGKTGEGPLTIQPRGGRVFRSLTERYIPDIPRCQQVKGVVFDLDDTLLEQKAWILDKLEMTWSVLAKQLPARTEFHQLAMRILEEGNRARLFDALCAELGLAEEKRVELIQTYRQVHPEKAHVYADVLPTLTQLRRHGLRLALLTDNPPPSQRLKIEVAGLAPLFDAIVLTGEIAAAKPDKAAFDSVAGALGLPGQELVMVGDNLYRDIQGALQAGYAHAFFLQRSGGFFNFRVEMTKRLMPELEHCTTLQSLQELLWYLPRSYQESNRADV